MLYKIMTIYHNIIESIIRDIGSPLGTFLRYHYYKKRFYRCGENVKIDIGVVFEGAENIVIGNDVWIDKYSVLIAGDVYLNENFCKIKNIDIKKVKRGCLYIGDNAHIGVQCVIQAHGGVFIGNYFTMSSGSKIYSLSNDVGMCKYGTNGDKEKYYICSPIYIGDNVWIGINSIVLGGVVSDNVFVSPNSIVLSSIPENSYVHGSPAKKIRNRFV